MYTHSSINKRQVYYYSILLNHLVLVKSKFWGLLVWICRISIKWYKALPLNQSSLAQNQIVLHSINKIVQIHKNIYAFQTYSLSLPSKGSTIVLHFVFIRKFGPIKSPLESRESYVFFFDPIEIFNNFLNPNFQSLLNSKRRLQVMEQRYRIYLFTLLHMLMRFQCLWVLPFAHLS